MKVPVDVLENEQNFYTTSLSPLKKVNLAKDFPLKVGGWTEADITLITNNLRSLQLCAGLSSEEMRQIFLLETTEEKRKKNLLGYYCSQGLSSARDPCEVFQKLKLIFFREAEKEVAANSGSQGKQRLTESPEYELLCRNIEKIRDKTPLDIAGQNSDRLWKLIYIFHFQSDSFCPED